LSEQPLETTLSVSFNFKSALLTEKLTFVVRSFHAERRGKRGENVSTRKSVWLVRPEGCAMNNF
jgi:hypothetical protein